jgi:hypothetical protein
MICKRYMFRPLMGHLQAYDTIKVQVTIVVSRSCTLQSTTAHAKSQSVMSSLVIARLPCSLGVARLRLLTMDVLHGQSTSCHFVYSSRTAFTDRRDWSSLATTRCHWQVLTSDCVLDWWPRYITSGRKVLCCYAFISCRGNVC